MATLSLVLRFSLVFIGLINDVGPEIKAGNADFNAGPMIAWSRQSCECRDIAASMFIVGSIVALS